MNQGNWTIKFELGPTKWYSYTAKVLWYHRWSWSDVAQPVAKLILSIDFALLLVLPILPKFSNSSRWAISVRISIMKIAEIRRRHKPNGRLLTSQNETRKLVWELIIKPILWQLKVIPDLLCQKWKSKEIHMAENRRLEGMVTSTWFWCSSCMHQWIMARNKIGYTGTRIDTSGNLTKSRISKCWKTKD